ncbi:hypothetical protein IQ231_17245 [Cuspidothrix issatschenkoi LEGE 03284]|uniref:hypothetical protein n=1 Tax=Cuspidothrix issatschenkoi TaxID=230752 RepID=UPI00187DF92B|nr:hypothetical protein [Cuspidothrix issatschenkoi]MBE9233370.1 hypothetical protein [Cuspidothrix issatschenkoi LEGE 03284]
MNNPKKGFFPGQRLERLYEEVCDHIYPQLKKQKKGVLSTVIHLIVPEYGEEICASCYIDNKASLEDDLSISSDIIGLFITNPDENKKWIIGTLKEGMKNARKSIGNKLEDDDMKLFQIVVIGCLIVGASACLAYLKKKQELEKQSHKNLPLGNSSQQQKEPKPVSLCLVVAASILRENIKENYSINISDIEILIDSSSYFLCTESEEANKIQKVLELTEENIATVTEQREVYIRINIADGEEMIGKKVPYILKRNLPANGIGVVRKLACLKYLSVSGLENFNRII